MLGGELLHALLHDPGSLEAEAGAIAVWTCLRMIAQKPVLKL